MTANKGHAHMFARFEGKSACFQLQCMDCISIFGLLRPQLRNIRVDEKQVTRTVR